MSRGSHGCGDGSVMTQLAAPTGEHLWGGNNANNMHHNNKAMHLAIGGQQHPQSHNGGPTSDVINLQYMELEEFLLENAVAVVNSNGTEDKGFLQHQQQSPSSTTSSSGGDLPPSINNNSSASVLDQKQYHVSLEPRPEFGEGRTQGGDGELLLNMQQIMTSDPHSPPQSSCDSPPGDTSSSIVNTRLPPIRTISATTPTGRKSHSSGGPHGSNRRMSTSSSSSLLVVTPPATPQQPSPPSAHLNNIVSPPCLVPNERPAPKPRKAVKRSRKESVPSESKDDKYWKRRAKNNEAAKRSRDLRREKENHIMQRVAFLERENSILNNELNSIRMDNEDLRKRLSHYENV